MDNFLHQFIDDLFRQAGLDKLPADFKNEYREKLAVEAQKRLSIIAMRELDKASKEEFEELMSQENVTEERILVFLQRSIPNFQEKMQKALHEFAEEFLESVKNIRS